jgi:hypothetical protein
MIAKITRIDNKGETTVAEEHVESFKEAFDMFMDDVLNRKMDDFYVWEDYDRMARGRNNLLMDKKLNSLERRGRLSETFLTGKYELVLEVQRVDQTEDLELFDDDYVEESGFMDALKSGWKKVKGAFADRPQVKLVGDGDKEEEVGYIHDFNRKNGTFNLILAQNKADESAIAGAVAGAVSAGRGGGVGSKP